MRGFFWRETPLRGICALEHKFVFGRKKTTFRKRLGEHKDEALERFLARSDGTVGQLLLVTQVSGSSKPAALATKLFYHAGSAGCMGGASAQHLPRRTDAHFRSGVGRARPAQVEGQ